MQLNIFVPKANHTFTCEVEDLPAESIAYALDYGIRQSVVDTTAGVKRVDFTTTEEFNAEALAKAQKRWDQIVSGNVPGTRTPNVEAAKARELMKVVVGANMTVEQATAILQAEAERLAQAA